MKFFSKLRSLKNKGKLALVALTLATGMVAVPVVHAEFYPNRPTYDYNKYDPANLNCDDPNNIAAQNGRCGSMNGPVFNSFINTPEYGDERPFFDGWTDPSTSTTASDPITNVQNSQEVTLRVYVHNDANQDTDCLPVHLTATGCSQIDNNAVGIAHGAQVSITLPTATAEVLRARADISATNASEVEDTVDMTGSEPFTLSYIPGSAVLIRNNVSYPLSDNIVSGGALIGNTVMDGNLPGCFNYAAVVEIKVKINVAPTPNLQVVKEVKIKGDANWVKQVTANPGQDVRWLIGVKDISNANLSNVIVRDVLPPHLQVVPGTVQLANGSTTTTLADTPLFAGGFNIGNYVPSGTEYVTFDTIAQGDFDTCSVTDENIAHARSDQTPTEVTDTANVVIQKQNCTPPPPPPSSSQTLACDDLTATVGSNRTVTFNAQATANGGASIVYYQYNFGDGTPVLSTDQTSVTHTYAQDGQYAATLNIQGVLNGQSQTVTSTNCAALVNFTTPTTPTTSVTPASTTPTALVNTGPGSVVALFTAATALGTFGYRWFLSRRLSRQ